MDRYQILGALNLVAMVVMGLGIPYIVFGGASKGQIVRLSTFMIILALFVSFSCFFIYRAYG